MEIDVAGMKVALDPRRAMVRIQGKSPDETRGGPSWEKQGVEVVLLFGILAALTKQGHNPK